MTRREKEAICRVLKQCANAPYPGTHKGSVHLVGRALCEVLSEMDSSFNMTLFRAAAGIPQNPVD